MVGFSWVSVEGVEVLDKYSDVKEVSIDGFACDTSAVKRASCTEMDGVHCEGVVEEACGSCDYREYIVEDSKASGEPKKVEPSVTHVPNDFGGFGRAQFTSEDSVERRLDKRSGLGWKIIQDCSSFMCWYIWVRC